MVMKSMLLGIAIGRANKRTSILNSALKKLSSYEKPKTFELFSPKSFKAYIDAGRFSLRILC